MKSSYRTFPQKDKVAYELASCIINHQAFLCKAVERRFRSFDSRIRILTLSISSLLIVAGFGVMIMRNFDPHYFNKPAQVVAIPPLFSVDPELFPDTLLISSTLPPIEYDTCNP